MFDEITSNLIDRYNNYIKDGNDSDEAYIKTINTLGEFDLNTLSIKETYEYNPNWANISLWVSLGLAVLGTIVLLLNNTMSILFTGVSISLYIGAAYYLYHLSQYSLKVEKNVKKHNELLKGIFKNLKTSFIFWNISISYWITSILGGFIVALIAFNTSGNVADFDVVITVYIVLFIIIFAILYFIFSNVYLKIEQKYYELTQGDKLESYISKKK